MTEGLSLEVQVGQPGLSADRGLLVRILLPRRPGAEPGFLMTLQRKGFWILGKHCRVARDTHTFQRDREGLHSHEPFLVNAFKREVGELSSGVG